MRAYTQSGCTDPVATNYDPNAVVNDGSCIYAPSFQSVYPIGSLLPQANESSGLVLSDGFLWTHNDHGGKSEIYKVDTSTGLIVQTVTISNFANTDWEDISADDNYIYIGDCGNNDGDRTDLKILKVNKSQFISSNASAVSVTAEAINFSYADQTVFTPSSTHNFDCESVMAIHDSLYLFTKDRGDLQTRVYKLPKAPGTYSISPYTSYNVEGLITGADYDKQHNEIVLIGYEHAHLNSLLYYLNDFKNDQFFSGNKRRIEIGNSTNDWQTEGVAYNSVGNLYLSCETSYVPATLYKTGKYAIVPLGIAEVQMSKQDIKIYPNPAKENITIECKDDILLVEVIDQTGHILISKKVNQQKYILAISSLPKIAASYILKIKTNKAILFNKIMTLGQ